MKKNILIVDDSKVVCLLFKEILEESGFRPVIANDYHSAKSLLQSDTSFFAAVVDRNLPDAPKGEIVDLVLKHRLATIVTTGTDDEAIRRQFEQKRIVDYIIKDDRQSFLHVLTLLLRLEKNSSIKILVVDDSTTFLHYNSALLQSHNFKVVTALDGEKALRELEEHPDISLILTDFEMPNMNGLGLIQNVRRQHDQESLPIIVISSVNDSSITVSCLRSGANDYIGKPFHKDEFYSRVYLNVKHVEFYNEILQNQILLKQYKHIVDDTNIISKTDARGRITYVNDKFCTVSGFSEKELIGAKHNIIRHPDTPPSTFQKLWSAINMKKSWHGVLKNRAKNHRAYYVDSTIVPILDEKGSVTEIMAISKDITQLMQQKLIIKEHTTDALTNLPNRQKLIDELKRAKKASVILINIDSFKEINDFYGHDIGDGLLLQFANRLMEIVPADYAVYKLHADEFALKSTHTDDEMKPLLDTLVATMQNSIFPIEENDIYVNITIGVSCCTERAFIKADHALQYAKSHKKTVLFFNEEILEEQHYGNNLKWLKKLKNALNENRIIAFYQPIVDNKTGKITKYEALVRMIDESNAPIAPFFFLDIAKKTKLYPMLTKAVITHAFTLFSYRSEECSVNLSAEDIHDEQMRAFILEQITLFQIADRIIFEIVESEGIENIDKVLDFIHAVKALGCKISIDDFGTGYSNFEYLIKLNADIIKIDGSIIKKIETDRSAEILVKTIVDFAQQLGMKTVAEFVENESIFNKVKALGVDFSQGYYFSKPLDQSELFRVEENL